MTRPSAGGHSTYVAGAPATQLESTCRDTEQAQAASSAAPALDSDLRELYAAYAALVWRTLRRLGVPENLLEDGVQDVFLVVHRQWRKFEGRSATKTWIVGIAIRVAKDHRRTEVRRVHRMERLASWLSSGAEAADSPSEAVERREASELMHALLDELSDDLREVLVLVELEGFTIREACDAIGIRLRTGQRRLRTATNTLSNKVAKYLREDRRSYP